MSKLLATAYTAMFFFSAPSFAESKFCEGRYSVTSKQGETFLDLSERLNQMLPSKMDLYDLELAFGKKNKTCIGGPLPTGSKLEYNVNCEAIL
jgi:hypothetical protein